MKKDLFSIMDGATPENIDTILDDAMAVDAVDGPSADRIRARVYAKTGVTARPRRTGLRSWRRFAAAAACLALILSAALGTYAYAAEVKEYNAAVKFFNENDLPTEGLSRGEIKAVYRDITTKAFAYSKTAEVLERSISADLVGGFEITQADPTPEEIENLWNYKNCGGAARSGQADYRYHDEYKEGTTWGDLFARSHFEKYDQGELAWSVSFPEFSIQGYVDVQGGAVVFGRSPAWSSTEYAWMAKVSETGETLWKRRLENGFGREYIAAVLENEDGTLAVISRGDLRWFCLSQYSAEGELLNCRKTEIGNYGIWNAARLQDGYIVQLGSYMTDEYARLVKVDREGNLLDSFSYESEDSWYYITDMIEFNGKVYLSAYSVPAPENEDQSAGGRYEIASVLDYLFDNRIHEISSEELTPIVRANYTALLLVCDPGEGTPQKFYSAKGSMGGRLALDEAGNLLWDVESISSTFYSPATNSFTIGGTSSVFRYTFDGNGLLMSQEKTGETVRFHK